MAYPPVEGIVFIVRSYLYVCVNCFERAFCSLLYGIKYLNLIQIIYIQFGLKHSYLRDKSTEGVVEYANYIYAEG